MSFGLPLTVQCLCARSSTSEAMPYVSLTAVTGAPASFSYSISTPSNPSADAIDPALPTILCIHGVYIAQQIFESQFNDPRLRQFNLVAIDRLAHGETKGNVTADYHPQETAEDLAHVMDALNITSFHILALGVGTIIGAELAIAYPQRVKSLTSVSPAPFAEPEDVNQGRQQLLDYWHEMKKTSDNSYMEDIVFGAMQLLFHNNVNNRATAVRDVVLQQAFRNWMGTEEDVFNARVTNADFFTKRRVLTKHELSAIKAPIQFIHGQDDIAYPYQYTVDVAEEHRAAGNDVAGVYRVRGPHDMLLLSQKINPRLCDMVLRVEKRKDMSISHPEPLRTPWTDELAARGFYRPYRRF
ncbi:Alpha/Beta hydrolase protein [Schizophyllum amplum]|uniref:Alpha/Beta hydrolase protein n=1 Tax=Schizophyllum amplum TaxID=97359 RepID=A0A550C6B5_9AGAR|nr:Alpha/Beta hydrolase protein [Auriculariopsis ampla]